MNKQLSTFKKILCFSFTIFISSVVHSNKIISTEITGKGQPMILLHGMSCSSAVWDNVKDYYKENYEIHLVTLKGFGNMESAEVDHYLKSVRDEIIEYVKVKGLKNTILMGHSMGGFLSLWAAAAEPDLFAKIISVDGVPYFPVLQMPQITPESAKGMVKGMQESMKSMSDDMIRQNQKMIVQSMIATESKRDAVVEMGLNSNPIITGQAYGEMFTTDIRSEMEKIKTPVLVLGAWAGYEMYGATKESVELGFKSQIKEIENAQLEIADSAYHFIFYDEPEWFFKVVDVFLLGKK